ncbi:MAG: isoprenylcysteine carboxylmethyltransferase family protein [Ruminococcaceae bacterium]|nr:isoprenylcysteine carboxylmethyltransferase family protein [Oscillospiraceae bacterium]
MKKDKLPLYGAGPIYGIGISAISILFMILSKQNFMKSGDISKLKILFVILGIILIIGGIAIWVAAVVLAKIDDGIKTNTLVTHGIYTYCRNPIYTAITFVNIGALLMMHNFWLLILPFCYWAFMTVLLKHTEEKWLYDMFGEEYKDYCKRVNRCIPWRKRN